MYKKISNKWIYEVLMCSESIKEIYFDFYFAVLLKLLIEIDSTRIA